MTHETAFGEYLATLGPVRVQRVRTMLERPYRRGPMGYSRRALVEACIRHGWRLGTAGGRRVLRSPSGAFHDARAITRDGLRYAAFLERRARRQVPAVIEPVPACCIVDGRLFATLRFPDNYWEHCGGVGVNPINVWLERNPGWGVLHQEHWPKDVGAMHVAWKADKGRKVESFLSMCVYPA